MSLFDRVASNMIISYNDRTPRQRFGIMLGLFMTLITIFGLGYVTLELVFG